MSSGKIRMAETFASNQQRKSWVAAIREEHAKYLEWQETGENNFIHNREMQQRILKTWRLESPTMWASLQTAGQDFPAVLAFVLQERMWQREEELEKTMPYPDAMEQAEREILMLEPEADEPQNPDE